MFGIFLTIILGNIFGTLLGGSKIMMWGLCDNLLIGDDFGPISDDVWVIVGRFLVTFG